ncbi:response regulator transcription factor [Oscillochloris sp. ZM17-4]|uniref:response regulator transcription factor n=1 Tax=Oscillochloris sp. ZM17-4 TaxID=2866714 RepID=UPI001C72C573|nr:response regulator transcription factor [Oscillochloris sp. ZM17-4]MBX0330128.1 response regulator transcription factor [Oscillochloris sp. ZM17-4]
MSQRILIVEDEAEIAGYLRRGLVYEGYAVEVAGTGAGALAAARERPPDLVILDLGLPDIDGLDVARRLRAGPPLSILMLTARDAVTDRVAGLEGGADDYLTKPFAFEELLARVHVQLRRRSDQQDHEVRSVGPLSLDPAAHEVRAAGQRVELTAKEFEVLDIFMRHPRQVLTREQVYEQVWGYDFGSDSNVLEVYVRALRQKLEAAGAPRMIQTVRGVGYVLREDT